MIEPLSVPGTPEVKPWAPSGQQSSQPRYLQVGWKDSPRAKRTAQGCEAQPGSCRRSTPNVPSNTGGVLSLSRSSGISPAAEGTAGELLGFQRLTSYSKAGHSGYPK